MKKTFWRLLLALCSVAGASDGLLAQSMNRGGVSAPDPFVLNDSISGTVWRQTDGLTRRSQVINPAQKTLVLIVAGQSQFTNITPTTYVPSNSSAIDQFNVYDGGSYSINSGVLGTSYSAGYGLGNVVVRLADKLVANGIFDRVIISVVNIGGTQIFLWSDGPLADRGPAVMKRLASRGITPSTTGVTFAFLWGQGESDNQASTSQANYSSRLSTVLGSMVLNGFAGRFFVCKETWASGVTWAPVQAAQVAAANGTSIFSGGDLDSLSATYRQSDNTHWNDTGGDFASSIIYNAMRASGAPF